MPVQKADVANKIAVRPGLTRRLIYGKDVMMAMIEFSDGPWPAPEPQHRHVHEQVTYVAEGEILFFCEGEAQQRLTAGDMFWVPSNKKHGIQLLSPTAKLIDTFNPLREDFL